jgi:hypothetical protein
VSRNTPAVGRPSWVSSETPEGRHVYRSPGWGRDYPRLQILTIEDLLSERAELRMPPTMGPFKAAQRMDVGGEQQELW